MASPIFAPQNPIKKGAQPGMGPAFTLGETMFNTGKGLLSQPVAGNGFGNDFGSVAPSGVNQIGMRGVNLNNPAIRGMTQGIRTRTDDLLGDWMNQIQGNAVSSNTLGGSRQGLAQGTALAKGMDYYSSNMANMMGGLYENQANRNMQRYGVDTNSYNANRSMDLQGRGQMMDLYQGQRGQDLAQYGVGSGLVTQGLQTQWLPQMNAADIYGKFSDFGSGTSSSSQGGGWMGGLGGVMGGLQFAQNMGWLGNKNDNSGVPPNPYASSKGWW